MTSRDITELKPKVQRLARELVKTCADIGLPVAIICTYRSAEDQAVLYAQGRTTPGEIVTNAKPGQSLHQFRVAFDVAPIDKWGNILWNGNFDRIGQVGRKLGLEWGGDWTGFKDKAHFQYTAGYALSAFQKGGYDESLFADEPSVVPVLPPLPISFSQGDPNREATQEELVWYLAFLKWAMSFFIPKK